MLITTTTNVEGRRVREYRGLVMGEAILGANVFRDFFAGIRDIVGGRSGGYEKALRQAREIATLFGDAVGPPVSGAAPAMPGFRRAPTDIYSSRRAILTRSLRVQQLCQRPSFAYPER